jgi:hypothetical protein
VIYAPEGAVDSGIETAMTRLGERFAEFAGAVGAARVLTSRP